MFALEYKIWFAIEKSFSTKNFSFLFSIFTAKTIKKYFFIDLVYVIVWLDFLVYGGQPVLSTFGAVKGTSDCESLSAVAVSRKIAAKKTLFAINIWRPYILRWAKTFELCPSSSCFSSFLSYWIPIIKGPCITTSNSKLSLTEIMISTQCLTGSNSLV